MMTPVGRLVLVRSVDKRELINAMAWVTMPALIGPLLGPAARRLHHHLHLLALDLPDQRADRDRRHRAGDALHRGRTRRDARPVRPARHGAVGTRRSPGWRSASRCSASTLCRWPIVLALIAGGATIAFAYVRHARRTPAPVLDLSLLADADDRAASSAASCSASAIGAMPFLLPLLLQLGFSLTAFQSGLITLSTAVGALVMKTVIPIILRRFGFSRGAHGQRAWSAPSSSRPARPSQPACRSLDRRRARGRRLLPLARIHQPQHASPTRTSTAERMSRATSLVAVGQQVSLSAGVAIGALTVDLIAACAAHGDHGGGFPAGLRRGGMIAGCAVIWSRDCRTTPAPNSRNARPAPSPTEAADQKL